MHALKKDYANSSVVVYYEMFIRNKRINLNMYCHGLDEFNSAIQKKLSELLNPS